MLTIAPSILAANFANLAKSCENVLTPQHNLLHFDVMDGVFVPNISVGIPVLKSLKTALPNAVYDVHLMIIKPHKYIEEFAKAGANYITFHVESESDVEKTLAKIKAQGCKAGLSLRPGTSLQAVYPFLKMADLILVMSVEPGFGGQGFMPNAVQRIAQIKKEAQRQETPLIIEVDGGINLETAPLCINAGANILVAGSAVFAAENPKQMLN